MTAAAGLPVEFEQNYAITGLMAGRQKSLLLPSSSR